MYWNIFNDPAIMKGSNRFRKHSLFAPKWQVLRLFFIFFSLQTVQGKILREGNERISFLRISEKNRKVKEYSELQSIKEGCNPHIFQAIVVKTDSFL